MSTFDPSKHERGGNPANRGQFSQMDRGGPAGDIGSHADDEAPESMQSPFARAVRVDVDASGGQGLDAGTCLRMNQQLPDGVAVDADGQVYAEAGRERATQDIDWATIRQGASA